MRGDVSHVVAEIRDLIRCDLAMRAAESSWREADEARRQAARELENAHGRVGSAIEDGESLMCDGYLITRRVTGGIDAIQISRVVRLD